MYKDSYFEQRNITPYALSTDYVCMYVLCNSETSEERRQFQVRRAQEIYVNMKEVKQLARERSLRVNQSVEERWKESKEKVKVFERTRKASFNKARQLSKKVGT